MSTPIIFRRCSTTLPSNEVSYPGQGYYDLDNKRFGVSNGEPQPRWYPKVTINGDMVANANTNVALATSTFANLGTPAQAGSMKFCTNARKPGQGTGAGTGMIVVWDGTVWTTTAGAAVTI